jgi:hypothetical protein
MVVSQGSRFGRYSMLVTLCGKGWVVGRASADRVSKEYESASRSPVAASTSLVYDIASDAHVLERRLAAMLAPRVNRIESDRSQVGTCRQSRSACVAAVAAR